ncbi:MAG TPA: guanitoxin biosynthesis MATE family efflux transporter GntT [Trichocoleus sp.]|jgi:MATE family multidrug resistance protein
MHRSPSQPPGSFASVPWQSRLSQIDFLPRFFRLAIVNVLSNLMVPLSGLVSIAFLGHLSEIYHLTGVTIATVLFNYIYRTLGFLRMGTTGVTAQAVGRGDRAAVLLTGLRNGMLALGLGLLILLMQIPLRELGFTLLNASTEVRQTGQAYFDARIWGAPATLLNFVLIGWFLGQEQGGKVLLLSVVGNGMNIFLDYWLIVRLGLESTGAGWATAISQYGMAIGGLLLISREIKWQEVKSIASELFDPTALKQSLVLNSNIFIRTFTFLSTFTLFISLSAAMGTEILAANALLLQIVTLAAYFIDGLAYATESLIGIFQGEGSKEKFLPLLGLSGATSLLIGFGLALSCAIAPHQVFGLLTYHQQVLSGLSRVVLWLVPVLGFGALAFMLDGYFLGLAAGVTLRNAALLATLIGFAPGAIVAWQLQNPDVLWLAMAMFMAARALLLAIQVPKTLKES